MMARMPVEAAKTRKRNFLACAAGTWASRTPQLSFNFNSSTVCAQ